MDGPQNPDFERAPDGTFSGRLERQRAEEEARGRARRAKILAAIIIPLAAASMAFDHLTREPSRRRSEEVRRRLEAALSNYTHQDVVLMIGPFEPVGKLDQIVSGTGASLTGARNDDGYLVLVADAATWWTRGPHCIVARIAPDGTRRVDVERPPRCDVSSVDPRHPGR